MPHKHSYKFMTTFPILYTNQSKSISLPFLSFPFLPYKPKYIHQGIPVIHLRNYCCIKIMNKQTKALTFRKLKIQRIKQIQREGVFLTFHLRSYPYKKYFSFDPTFTARLQDMIGQNKYPLQLCDDEGATVLKIKSTDLYFSKEREEKGKVMISSDIFFGRGGIEDGVSFYLAKANPTLRAYKDIYSFDQNQYQSQQFDESSHIIDYLKEKAENVESRTVVNFAYQKDLNQKQNQAIMKCGRNGLTFIKGPPGCGKTKTIGRLCRLFLEQQMKVIVGAVSNTGNLSIVRELINEMEGHNFHGQLEQAYSDLIDKAPDKCFEWLAHCYDNYIPYSIIFYPPFQLKQDELPPLVRLYSFDTIVMKNMVRVCNNEIPTQFLIDEYRKLKIRQQVQNKFYAIFMQATAITLSHAKVVISTTVKSKSINAKLSPQYHYQPDVAILDEASQSSCSDTLCYLKLDVEKLVLVGDDKQLNPTVISNDKVLKESFFVSFAQKKDQYFTMLNQQYRMHPHISRISNTLFYQGLITDGVTPAQRASPYPPFTEHPVLFINCHHPQREGVEETGSGSKKTYTNPYEVYIIKVYLACLPREEISKVGIITPYVDQLKMLQREFAAEVKQLGLTIRTCDGFQGGERDYIFISLVRSNPQGNIGFCGEESRINVSITRARRGMMIVGNAATFGSTMNYWGIITNHVNSQLGYFDYSLEIPQAEIQAIINRKEQVLVAENGKGKVKRQGNGRHRKKDEGNEGYPSFEEYKHQFLKVYPHQNEQVLQAHYTEYINNLQNYYYEQQYQANNSNKLPQKQQQNPSKINIIIGMLEQGAKGIVGDEDEDENERFLKLNKAEVRQLRRMDLFKANNQDQRSVKSYIQEIMQILDKLPNSFDDILKRLTHSIKQQYLAYFKQVKSKDPLQHLQDLLAQISRKDYEKKHQKENENLGYILKWGLLKKLTQLI